MNSYNNGNTEYTNYGQYNMMTATGRITYVEIKPGRNGEFLSLNVVTTLSTDGQEIDLTIADSGQLLDMFKRGYLMKGREITISGHILNLRFSYNDKNGVLQMLTRPQAKLVDCAIFSGGLGRIPKSAQQQRAQVTPAAAKSQAPVDATPAVETEVPW